MSQPPHSSSSFSATTESSSPRSLSGSEAKDVDNDIDIGVKQLQIQGYEFMDSSPRGVTVSPPNIFSHVDDVSMHPARMLDDDIKEQPVSAPLINQLSLSASSCESLSSAYRHEAAAASTESMILSSPLSNELPAPWTQASVHVHAQLQDEDRKQQQQQLQQLPILPLQPAAQQMQVPGDARAGENVNRAEVRVPPAAGYGLDKRVLLANGHNMSLGQLTENDILVSPFGLSKVVPGSIVRGKAALVAVEITGHVGFHRSTIRVTEEI